MRKKMFYYTGPSGTTYKVVHNMTPCSAEDCQICREHREYLVEFRHDQMLRNMASGNLKRHMKSGNHYTLSGERTYRKSSDGNWEVL